MGYDVIRIAAPPQPSVYMKSGPDSDAKLTRLIPQVWRQLAEAFSIAGDQAEAMQCVGQAQALCGPWALPLHLTHARVLRGGGQLVAALEILETASALQPDYSPASSLLGEGSLCWPCVVT